MLFSVLLEIEADDAAHDANLTIHNIRSVAHPNFKTVSITTAEGNTVLMETDNYLTVYAFTEESLYIQKGAKRLSIPLAVGSKVDGDSFKSLLNWSNYEI